MGKLILKRLLMMIPVLLGATLIVFTVMEMSPGDPALAKLGSDATPEALEQVREEMGLNDPFLVRYGSFVAGLVQGDLGQSYKNDLDVMDQLMERLPNTILLAGAALVFAVVVGVPVGILSARKQYSFLDNICMALTLLGASAPNFWLGMMLVMLFALKLGVLPATGMAEGSGFLASLILPTITLGLQSAALLARMTRSAMLDVLRQDYVDTARSKGIAERRVIFHHQLRNALIPIITTMGLQLGVMLGGAVTVETIFAWPGIGRYIVESINLKDTPCVLGAVVMLAIMLTCINLVVDVIYAFVDPRIKSQYNAMTKRRTLSHD